MESPAPKVAKSQNYTFTYGDDDDDAQTYSANKLRPDMMDVTAKRLFDVKHATFEGYTEGAFITGLYCYALNYLSNGDGDQWMPGEMDDYNFPQPPGPPIIETLPKQGQYNFSEITAVVNPTLVGVVGYEWLNDTWKNADEKQLAYETEAQTIAERLKSGESAQDILKEKQGATDIDVPEIDTTLELNVAPVLGVGIVAIGAYVGYSIRASVASGILLGMMGAT
jgi:hypothetical protein